jgi:hypothetical protein
MSRTLIFGPLLAVICASHAAWAGDLPDRGLTAGGVLTTDTAKVCKRNYIKSIPPAPSKTVDAVFGAYGIAARDRGNYKIDQLVSLDLGGSNDIYNLWPQNVRAQPWNTQAKDMLEKRLRKLVCAGQVSLADAQRALATDWIAAYKQWMGGLPTN